MKTLMLGTKKLELPEPTDLLVVPTLSSPINVCACCKNPGVGFFYNEQGRRGLMPGCEEHSTGGPEMIFRRFGQTFPATLQMHAQIRFNGRILDSLEKSELLELISEMAKHI